MKRTMYLIAVLVGSLASFIYNDFKKKKKIQDLREMVDSYEYIILDSNKLHKPWYSNSYNYSIGIQGYPPGKVTSGSVNIIIGNKSQITSGTKMFVTGSNVTTNKEVKP